MRTKIDLKTWERIGVYNFFQSFLVPVYSLTSEVDCTEAFNACKANHTSYAVRCLYAAMRAKNEVRELRYRVEDNGESVYEYDVVNLVTPVRVNDAGSFVDVFVPYSADFDTFSSSFEEAKCAISENRPTMNYMNEMTNESTVAFISCVPDLYFTSLNSAYNGSKDYQVGLVAMGKVVLRNGRWVMPVAITAHHGLCDGHHLSLFFQKVEQYLQS